MKVSKEILKIIEQTADKSIEKFAKKDKIQDNNYYKKTEFLLYSYTTLKDIVEIAENDIQDMIIEGETGTSKDISTMPKPYEGVKVDKQDLIQERIEAKKESIKVTEFDLRRIERALEQIEADDMDFIRMKYFDKMTISHMAENLHCSDSTIKRKRKEIVNRVALRLFGSEVIGI